MLGHMLLHKNMCMHAHTLVNKETSAITKSFETLSTEILITRGNLANIIYKDLPVYIYILHAHYKNVATL